MSQTELIRFVTELAGKELAALLVLAALVILPIWLWRRARRSKARRL